MPERIKIGMIGTGHSHASGKLAALRASDEYEVVGVAESDDALRRTRQGQRLFHDLPFMTTDQLLNHRGLKAVAVEGRVHELLSAAEKCVAAGMHLHLDKPPGVSLGAFRGLVDQMERKHLVLQMGYMFRYNAGFELLHQLLADKALGRIYRVSGVIGKVISPSSREPLTRYSGGLMFELACHLIDQLVYVLGAPRIVTPYLRHDAAIDDGLADNTLAVFEFEHASATIESAAMEVEGFARRQFVVCGEHGVFDLRPIEPPAVRLALDAPRGPYKKGYQVVEVENRPRYVADFVDFARCIRGEKTLAFTTTHDVNTHEALLRASGMPTDT